VDANPPDFFLFRRTSFDTDPFLFLKRVTSILLILLFTLLLLVGVVLFVLLTPSGQNFLTLQVNKYLKKKLNTRVEIGHIRLQWPTALGLDNLYIGDLKGDTLVAAVRLEAGINMWGLLRGKIAIDEVVLEEARAKVYRKSPDKEFNYQFIIDAFASEEVAPAPDASTPLDMSWNSLRLKQVHLSYYDAASGVDADVQLPDGAVDFDAFNPSFSRYHPRTIALKGADVKVNLFDPVDLGLPVSEVSSTLTDTLDLKLNQVDFRDLKIAYSDKVSGMITELSFPKLLAEIEDVYLDGQRVNVQELAIEGANAMVLFEKVGAPTTQSLSDSSEVPVAGPGWAVSLGHLKLADSQVKFDDDNVAAQPRGVDFSHLHVTRLDGDLKGFHFSPDSIAGNLVHLQLDEKSGFSVKQAKTNFTYANKQAYLKELVLQTPHSRLGDNVVLQYRDSDQLASDLGQVRVDLNLVDSKLGFRDLLLLAPDLSQTPPFDTKPNGFVMGNARITGSVNDLQIKEAVFSMPEATQLAVSGSIKGLPEVEKMAVQLNLQELTASRSDLLAILPKGSLPDSIQLPESVSLTGTVDGSLAELKLDAKLQTSAGNATLTGEFSNITDSLQASYKGSAAMDGVNVGQILMQPADQIGIVSLRADFSGTGLTLSGANASVNGVIERADLLGYTYRDLSLSGAVENGLAVFKASSNDPNADLTVQGKADLNQEYPSVNMEAGIRRLDLNKLKLYSDSISLVGNFLVNLSSTNPDNPLGVLEANEFTILRKDQRIPVGPLKVSLSSEAEKKHLVVESSFANATLDGQFDYTSIGGHVAAELDRYIQLSDTVTSVSATPFSIVLSGSLKHHPAVEALVPALTKLDQLDFSARLSNASDSSLAISLNAPQTIFDSTRVSGLRFTATGDGKKLIYSTAIDEIQSGDFRVRNFSLNGDAADNLATGRLSVKDSVGKDQHIVGTRIRKEGEDFVIGLNDRLLFNYVPWRADTTGKVRYGSQGLLVSNFSIYRNRSKERLIINSVADREGGSPYPNGPIRITADSISIGPLVALVTRDPKLASGRLDGDILIRDYMGEAPVFMGDVSIDSLQLQEVALGDFKLQANNEKSKVIDLEMSLKGQHNDVALEGKYASGSTSPLDLEMDINRLSASLIEAFSGGELQRGKGELSGNLSLQGSVENPKINGDLSLKSLAFHVSQMGARYTFEDGTIRFDAPNMRFNKLGILDTLGQRLDVDGRVTLSNLPNVGYDLKIGTKRFMLLNASRQDNDLVYGKAFAAADLSVKGKGTESIVDGTVKILKGSDVTLILPDDDGLINRGDGIVEFVRREEEQEDSSEVASEETTVVVDFASELSLNIETDPDAQFTIVLDEMNGDNLQVKGNARLNTGLAPNGQLYLLGSYELEAGAYELTFEILKKQFEIRKGSQLIWSGDPMQAELDITAVYGVSADPSTFSPSNTAYGKIPFNVLLKISGNLTNPKIVFDLEVDERAGSSVINKINEEQILTSFRADPSEMNKQVFGLLLLNKFMAETANVSTEGFNAEAIARQSVSKMLSDQLNNLASDLIKGVQLDFNLNSTSGSTGARTDLNVGLTKGFMNDRVTVSVGRNFELENSGQSAQSSEIFDNIAVNYKVTRDGRYVVRAYRKNQFQTVLEGFIVETGVSFIVTLDYDAVKEFFRK
jgi:translocation and assembly module TamB